MVQVTVESLSGSPHELLHRIRSRDPVTWIEDLDCWLVTGYDLCAQVMLDSETFTVDDPRFSTQQVIGPSMLSLDGIQHRRHRLPFSDPFRAGQIRQVTTHIRKTADELLGEVARMGSGDLRWSVAGPLAVEVMSHVLDLPGLGADEILDIYNDIVDAVDEVTNGGPVPESGTAAFRRLEDLVTKDAERSRLLRAVTGSGDLSNGEIVSNVAVLLFGGIVTSESGTAMAFRNLLTDPELTSTIDGDRSLVAPFVEETFRLEPSAAAIDRYATRDVVLGEKSVREGDLVRVSLGAANRDPVVFPDPDILDLHRGNVGRSLTFARGPHSCLGIHLARLEARVAVEALLDHAGTFSPRDLAEVTGLIFRAPARLVVDWEGDEVGTV